MSGKKIKRFSVSKYLQWTYKTYKVKDKRNDLWQDTLRRVLDGSHYACHLEGRTIASIKKEGWSVMDDWIIEN